jgi:precorrin-6Y C5,15-methyltransferase (decarboxylating)
VNKIYVIGIGFRPLDKRAKEIVLTSDVILSNNRLQEVFKNYSEYENVKDRIKILSSVYENVDYIRENYKTQTISLLAAGDPMFFGIGRLITEEFARDIIEIYPDLSSVQVAFSRIKQTWNGAFLISVHGGPDPSKRRKLEYELTEIPALLDTHKKMAILTDRENTPAEIAKNILKPSAVSFQPITEGTTEEFANKSFEHPNVLISLKGEEK